MAIMIPVKEVESASTGVVGPIVPARADGGASAMQSVGGALQDAAPKIAAIYVAADKERVDSEMESIEQFKREAIDDPEKGALAAKGANALPAMKDAMERFEGVASEVRGRLGNGRQRAIFEEKIRAQRNMLWNNLDAHARQQIAIAGEIGYKAALAGAKTDAARALSFGNVEDYLQAKKDLFDSVDAKRHLESWNDRTASVMLMQEQSELHSEVLRMYVNSKRYAEAKQYLEDNQAEIDPGSKTAWKAAINKEGQVAMDAQYLDTFWARARKFATNPTNGRFEESWIRDMFQQEVDPETRGRIDKDFDRLVAIERSLQNEEDVQRLARIMMDSRATRRLDMTAQDYRALDDDGKNKAQGILKVFEREARADRVAAKQEQQIDNQTNLNDFYSMAPEDAAKMTDEQILAKYTTSDALGISQIRRARQTITNIYNKGLEVPFGQARTYWNNAVAKILNEGTRKQFDTYMMEWYSALGRAATDKEINDKLSEALVLLDIPWSRDMFRFQNPTGTYPAAASQPFTAPAGTAPAMIRRPSDPTPVGAVPVNPQGGSTPAPVNPALTPNDQYAEYRSQLRPGYILIRRGNGIKGIPPEQYNPQTDTKL